MTKEELKIEVKIQEAQKNYDLTETYQHNIKCIDEMKVDENTKQDILNSIKKEFVSNIENLQKKVKVII